MTSLTPSHDALLPIIRQLRVQHPDLGASKLLLQLKTAQPEWAVSEKRLRKLLQMISPTIDEPGLVADTHMDPTLQVTEIAPKVKAKMFGGEKGKGLVAREKIQEGEVVWQEEPWVVTADG